VFRLSQVFGVPAVFSIWVEIPRDSQTAAGTEMAEQTKFDVITNVSCVSVLHLSSPASLLFHKLKSVQYAR